jgi:hypothetical protein
MKGNESNNFIRNIRASLKTKRSPFASHLAAIPAVRPSGDFYSCRYCQIRLMRSVWLPPTPQEFSATGGICTRQRYPICQI